MDKGSFKTKDYFSTYHLTKPNRLSNQDCCLPANNFIWIHGIMWISGIKVS
jgi:hypothetical protein